jgi:hypothetical protein
MLNILKLLNLMINMNIFFEFMSMILKNHIFKVDISRFFEMQVEFYFLHVVSRNKIGFK